MSGQLTSLAQESRLAHARRFGQNLAFRFGVSLRDTDVLAITRAFAHSFDLDTNAETNRIGDLAFASYEERLTQYRAEGKL